MLRAHDSVLLTTPPLERGLAARAKAVDGAIALLRADTASEVRVVLDRDVSPDLVALVSARLDAVVVGKAVRTATHQADEVRRMRMEWSNR